jgi:hypothetical protein
MDSIQPKTVLSLLDVIGSTIVDIFYNHMYDRAIGLREKKGYTITDAYRLVITEYMNDVHTPHFYKTLINSIHYYTRISTVYNNMSFVECIDLYIGLFVPRMYIVSLNQQQKHDIFSLALQNTMIEFSNDIVTNQLQMIIDEHLDPTNIEILQDNILRILTHQRELSYSNFLDSQKTTNVQHTSSKSSKSNGNKALEKITVAYKQSIEDRVKIKNKYLKLQMKYNNTNKQLNELKTLFLKQIEAYKIQNKELMELKAVAASTAASVASNDDDHSEMISYTMEQKEETDSVGLTEETPDIDDLFQVKYM